MSTSFAFALRKMTVFILNLNLQDVCMYANQRNYENELEPLISGLVTGTTRAPYDLKYGNPSLIRFTTIE